MKVLMTADTIGGVWTYAMELARALPEVEFILATMGNRPSDRQRADVPPNVTLAASTFRLEWMEQPWDDVANAGYWLLDLEQAHAPDLVHLNGYTHAAWPFETPKIVIGHSCVLSWWNAVKNEDPPAEWRRYHDNVEQGLQSAGLVVAPSRAMLDALHAHYDFDTSSKVIYNGRTPHPALRATLSPLSRGEGRHSRRLGEGRNQVFAAGRLWDQAKNITTVVRAAPKIEWPVHIAGEGGADAPNVTHHGKLDPDAMQERFEQAGIYLFPALYEPFGLSILEAALAGCALVIGDIPSLREIWDDAATYVPPRDAGAIADTVNGLISDPQRLNEMASRAAQRASRYTPHAMADAYERVYVESRRALEVRG